MNNYTPDPRDFTIPTCPECWEEISDCECADDPADDPEPDPVCTDCGCEIDESNSDDFSECGEALPGASCHDCAEAFWQDLDSGDSGFDDPDPVLEPAVEYNPPCPDCERAGTIMVLANGDRVGGSRNWYCPRCETRFVADPIRVARKIGC